MVLSRLSVTNELFDRESGAVHRQHILCGDSGGEFVSDESLLCERQLMDDSVHSGVALRPIKRIAP